LVDINISGLQSGGLNAFLGGWQMDFKYDPRVFVLNMASSTISDSLGNVALGEVVPFGNTTPGNFFLGAVSLLEADATSCVFCIGPYLSDLQSDSFTLATIGLYAPGASGFSGDSLISTANIILSDAMGNALGSDINPPNNIINPRSSIAVPEPGTLLLLLLGVVGLCAVRVRRVGFQFSPSMYSKIVAGAWSRVAKSQ
jgi:hypothetical protein